MSWLWYLGLNIHIEYFYASREINSEAAVKKCPVFESRRSKKVPASPSFQNGLRPVAFEPEPRPPVGTRTASLKKFYFSERKHLKKRRTRDARQGWHASVMYCDEFYRPQGNHRKRYYTPKIGSFATQTRKSVTRAVSAEGSSCGTTPAGVKVRLFLRLKDQPFQGC